MSNSKDRLLNLTVLVLAFTDMRTLMGRNAASSRSVYAVEPPRGTPLWEGEWALRVALHFDHRHPSVLVEEVDPALAGRTLRAASARWGGLDSGQTE